MKRFKIRNPYATVAAFLGDPAHHYKTNLHTHSTVSDGTADYADMIKGHYYEGFDILAMTDHGIIGRPWNQKPAELPLYYFQYLVGNKKTPLTDEEFAAITDGTYPAPEGARTPGRGMHCLCPAIERNMVTWTKSHVNGFFVTRGEGDWGKENGFLYAVKDIADEGGVSFINHPGDWLESTHHPENATKPENVRFFGDIFVNYPSCVGTEIFNYNGHDTKNDRLLWDALLRYVIPHGRSVWGFANSDAHKLDQIDTSFMDFILPEAYSDAVMRTAMESGTFFAQSRYAVNELGEGFHAEGPLPRVTALTADEDAQTVSVTAENASKIQWIADGKVLAEASAEGGTVASTFSLTDHADNISCYVRFQVLGKGGITASQAITLDDGALEELIIKDPRSVVQKVTDEREFARKSTRLYILRQETARSRARKKARKAAGK